MRQDDRGSKRGGSGDRSFGGRRDGDSGNFGGGFRGNNFSGGGNFNSGPREFHKAVCSECKAECEVPFKPTEGKPVYCRNCFAKHKPQRF